MRVWLSTFARAGRTHIVGRQAEESGFDGILLTDSQCLVADPFVELAAVADATTDLLLGTCATNTVVRHPTVLAASATTLQVRSGGRMVLGVGRGDSAVAKVGLHPATPEEFGESLADLRALVGGREVAFDDHRASLAWLDGEVPPVPVFGVASGPHAIEACAHNADGLILQVGSDPAAVRRCTELARTNQRSADFIIAVYAIVGLHDGQASAPPIDGVTPLLARMAAGTLADHSSPQAEAAAEAARSYRLETHGLEAAGAGHPEIEDYAVTGDAEHCAALLLELAEAGGDELVVILGSATTPTSELLELIKAFGEQVRPRLARA